MNRLAKLPLLLATTWIVMDVAPALASPTDRDHRVSARDHRAEARPVTTVSSRPRRYRRRPGPRWMMPLKIDIGAQGANTSNGFLPGIELRAGIHWASLSPEPTNFDLGSACSAPR